MKYSIERPLTIYTDGSCQNYKNPETRKKKGHGGWAAIVLLDNNLYLHGFAHAPQTNQRMEIMAVLEALRWARSANFKNEDILIRTDSMHVINGCISGWMDQCDQLGWEGVANADLWRKMYKLTAQFPRLRFRHVKGHAGNKYNEMADRIASNARRNGLLGLQRAAE